MSSSSRFFVSGTQRKTNSRLISAKAAYSPYAKLRPMLDSAGKVAETAQFAAHCAAAATASAEARIRLGNISPSSTQTSGPQVVPKNITKAFAATSATVDHGSGRVMESAPGAISPKENASAIRPRETVMPAEPTSSISRRPTLSTSRIAMIVATMFITEVIVLVSSAWDSSKPTDCHSVVE